MFTSRTTATLLATAVLAAGMSGTALAQQDLRSPDARDAARSDVIARQMRRFAAAPAPTPAQPTAVVVADGETPWLPIALMGAFSLAVVAISGAYVARVRRRTAGVLS